MRALVIGASGFLGLNVVDALLARGHHVLATQRKRTITLLLNKRRVPLVRATLDDADSLRFAMDGCETVFLTGGFYPHYSLDPEESIAIGIRQIRNVCEAAGDTGVKCLVYTSSIASLGRARNGVRADERDIADAAPADSTYRAVKWWMERELLISAPTKLRTVTLLPGGCIGPWDFRAGTSSLMLGVIRRELPWWVDGTVNIVDVGDVADAHVLAAEGDHQGRFCLGGHDVRMATLLPHVADRFGGEVPPHPISMDEARARADRDEIAARPTGSRVAVPRELVDIIDAGQPVSNARAERELGVRFRPLDESLDRAHEWFVRFRYLKKPAMENVV